MDNKRDFWQIMLSILLVTLVTILAFGGRRYVYAVFQHTAFKIGINLNNIANSNYVDWIKSQPDDLENSTSGVFLGADVPFIDSIASISQVLGTNTPDDNKWIEVDLSEQKLYMKENGNTTNSFLVSTGKWAPTPKGEWRIWTKLRYTRMQGGSKALGTYYNLPNVPYTMYYNQGYGIHGAYWHNNFGNVMSHGCVNMKPEEAGIVFNWATVGTRVIVHD